MVKELIDQYYKTHDFTKQAVRFVENPSLINELVEVAISDLERPYPEHASWLLVHISDLNPTLLENFQPLLIDRILTSKNQSVLRNLVNVVHTLPLIDHLQSELLDKLIEFIKDESNKPALFVYSLYKLIQFVQKYPEINNEIEGILELKQEPLKPSNKIGIRNYRKAVQ
jgi:hypothetical protein